MDEPESPARVVDGHIRSVVGARAHFPAGEPGHLTELVGATASHQEFEQQTVHQCPLLGIIEQTAGLGQGLFDHLLCLDRKQPGRQHSKKHEDKDSSHTEISTGRFRHLIPLPEIGLHAELADRCVIEVIL